MSKALSPRGVDSMTMGTRPDIVVGEERDGDEEEEEKDGGVNDDGDAVEVKSRRRLKLDDDEAIDGIVVVNDDAV